ncbi:MAG: aromatic ring-hydroxylating dioxygenase subunit alpha [Myxococcota bacterium]
MHRDLELALIRRALERRAPSAEGPDSTVAVALYTDAERFERELNARHRRHLNVVAHASELPAPGDFVTREILGVPAIVVRDDAGRARAFLNVCRHRGATVELRERGHCKRFVCPYHAWTYGRDGALASVRHRAGFPSLKQVDAGLVELACEEAGGFVWVCPDPKLRPTLDPDLRGLLAEVDGLGPERPQLFARTTRLWKANWKLLIEGGLESYHFKIAHRATVGPLFGDTTSQHARVGASFRLMLPRKTLPSLAERPEAEWKITEHANVLYMLHPNVSVLVQDGHLALLTMDPVSVDETLISVATVGRAPTGEAYGDKARTFLQANHDFTVKTLDEDFVLAEQIQRGFRTGANTELRFASFEGALREFHEGLESEMRDGAPAA